VAAACAGAVGAERLVVLQWAKGKDCYGMLGHAVEQREGRQFEVLTLSVH
jgi:hypothetical protein